MFLNDQLLPFILVRAKCVRHMGGIADVGGKCSDHLIPCTLVRLKCVRHIDGIADVGGKCSDRY
jgi:hypothetical protein